MGNFSLMKESLDSHTGISHDAPLVCQKCRAGRCEDDSYIVVFGPEQPGRCRGIVVDALRERIYWPDPDVNCETVARHWPCTRMVSSED
jgi:hypothetical protein